jgi:hypothetical protein
MVGRAAVTVGRLAATRDGAIARLAFTEDGTDDLLVTLHAGHGAVAYRINDSAGEHTPARTGETVTAAVDDWSRRAEQRYGAPD